MIILKSIQFPYFIITMKNLFHKIYNNFDDKTAKIVENLE
jgi:hypothetical protein